MEGSIEKFDLVVVEVSTLKEHRVGGINLNAHKVYHEALELGIDYRPFVNGNVADVPTDHVMSGLQVTRATPESVREDLLTLRSRVGVPVMTVDHLYYELPAGGPIPERALLTQTLRQISERDKTGFYSTKDLILKHGPETALEDQNHYRAAFEPTVAAGLLEAIRVTPRV